MSRKRRSSLSSKMSSPEFVEKLDNTFYQINYNNLDEIVNSDSEDDGLFYNIVYGSGIVTSQRKDKDTSSVKKKEDDENVPATNSLSFYYKDISKFNPLSREEERRVFTKYRRTRSKIRTYINKLPKNKKVVMSSLFKSFHKNYAIFCDEVQNLSKTHRTKLNDLLEEHNVIRNEIINRNLRFVIKISRRFWKDSDIETFKSIISAGNMGLFTAIDKYDPKKGTRFLSYAAHWITLEIRLELSNSSLVKIPIWWQKMVRKMFTTCTKEQGDMTTQELSARSKIPEQYIIQANNYQNVVNEKNFTLNTVPVDIEDKKQLAVDKVDYEEEISRKDIRARLQDFINALPTKEQGVVRLLFGLTFENKEMNLRQIGNIYNLSSERIRQIKEKALTTLHKNFKKIGYNDFNDVF